MNLKLSLNQFFEEAVCEKVDENNYTVYTDGKNRRGKILNCVGNNEFEAKESAYQYYSALYDAVKEEGETDA